jgi:predicted dehydrogenase
MREPISIGIVGIGYGQQVHAPAFRSDDRCRVVGICAGSKARALEVANRLAIPRAYGDWREMVADREIDAISIAVPPTLQVPIVQAAAVARKHVFCEKPVAPTAGQAREMLDAVERAGVVHAVDFLFPEIAAWKRARELLHEGRLGSLYQVNLTWRVETYAVRANPHSWKLSREQGGGTLNNLVSHSFYYLEWLLGAIERIAARISPAGSTDDLRIDLWLDFTGGVAGTMSVATDAFLGPGHRLEVYGDRGTLVLENRSSDHVSGFVLSMGTRANDSLSPIVTEVPREGQRDGRNEATAAIVRRFLDGIIVQQAVVPNLEAGLRVQELIERARASAAAETWQVVPGTMAHGASSARIRGTAGFTSEEQGQE